MQARRGRRHRPGPGGKAGLVAAVVVAGVLTDVGRQVNLAVAPQQGLNGFRGGALRRKTHDPATGLRVNVHDLQGLERLAGMLQLQDLARLEALGGFGQTEPIAAAHGLEHQ